MNFLIAILITYFISLIIIRTQKFHGKVTSDELEGLQKFHILPTPRIGGLGIFCGYIIIFFLASKETKELWYIIGFSGTICFALGFLEDITKSISPKIRFFSNIFCGFIFVYLSGYSIIYINIIGFDYLLSFYIFSLLFTGFAVGGVSHSINIIDGFNGLASGTIIIILIGFSTFGLLANDSLILELSFLYISLLLGFMMLNFPFGKIFLGDSGAYFSGYFLACMAVLLPFRNPEISPWISLILCAYPIIETFFSIYRKFKRKGYNPFMPDRVHLHMLVYRHLARRFANTLKNEKYRNPCTSIIMWTLSLACYIFSLISFIYDINPIFIFVLLIFMYILFYKKTSLN